MEEEEENVRKTIDGERSECQLELIAAIRKVTGQPPRGWYYGMVQSVAGARSRAIVSKVFKEEGLPLKWWGDSYSDDLPYWIDRPHCEGEGLLTVPYT